MTIYSDQETNDYESNIDGDMQQETNIKYTKEPDGRKVNNCIVISKTG